ncbi:hypothetical protein [Devosia faecipullorum]|nr:hypothetical protein [Devosia faecipullorum]
MSSSNFALEFKHDAARQITGQGYPVSQVSQRLGISALLLRE